MAGGVFRRPWRGYLRRAPFVPSAAVATQALAPDGLANAPAFGVAALAAGAVTLAPGGLANTPAQGTSALTSVVTLAPAGSGNAPAFGGTTVTSLVTLAPGGLANAPAFGGSAVTSGGAITPAGLGNTPGFGASTIAAGAVALQPPGQANTPGFGTSAVTSLVTLAPAGLANAPASGQASVTSVKTLAPAGLANAPGFGTSSLVGQSQTIAPAGLGNAPAFGAGYVLRGDNNLALGTDGYTDSNPKQLVRTSGNRLYMVVMECDAYPFEAGDRLMVYKANQLGIPTSFTQFIQSGITDIGTVAVALNAADNIEILTTSRAGTLAYRTWDTGADTMGSATTIDTGLESNLGQGDTNAALALDSAGVAHIVYLKSDGTRRRAYYRNNSGGSWSSATEVSSAVSFGANEKCWLPNIAVDGGDRQLVTFFVGTFNATADGEFYCRVRSAGSFGSTVNISGANNAWIEIDQSGSILITPDGRYHVSYVDTETNTDEAIRYAYSDDQGATWAHNNPGGGAQQTHNPTLGPGPGSDIRIYGHGTPDGTDHGDSLFYFQGLGGAAAWGPWTQWQAGTAFDSSVATRWSYNWHHFDQTLDVSYWDDNYPNLLQYAGWTYEGQVLPSGLGNAPAFGTAAIAAGAGPTTITPAGLANAPATGTSTLTGGAASIQPSGLANTPGFGTPALTPGAVSIAPAGKANTPAFGGATIASLATIAPSGAATTQGFGASALTPGAAAIHPSGLGNQPGYGATVLAGGIIPIETFLAVARPLAVAGVARPTALTARARATEFEGVDR